MIPATCVLCPATSAAASGVVICCPQEGSGALDMRQVGMGTDSRVDHAYPDLTSQPIRVAVQAERPVPPAKLADARQRRK